MTVAFICAVRTSHFAVILETKRADNRLRALHIRGLSSAMPASSASRASSRNGSGRAIGPGGRLTG
jgi:hypothetical protein